ncbi:hypothetical protein BJV82DRAFT_579359 [Fennellomyces sp. T-0311]|nr:hypothetical protein BJV82DRAFT_579359 [Fennellomyces sp. T-0311]
MFSLETGIPICSDNAITSIHCRPTGIIGFGIQTWTRIELSHRQVHTLLMLYQVKTHLHHRRTWYSLVLFLLVMSIPIKLLRAFLTYANTLEQGYTPSAFASSVIFRPMP